jgi:hypothetical protein
MLPFIKHFAKQAIPAKVTEVLLLFDNHGSHVYLAAIVLQTKSCNSSFKYHIQLLNSVIYTLSIIG